MLWQNIHNINYYYNYFGVICLISDLGVVYVLLLFFLGPLNPLLSFTKGTNPFPVQ